MLLEYGINKKSNLQKSSLTGFLSFYRVSLSLNMFCSIFCAISQLLRPTAIRDYTWIDCLRKQMDIAKIDIGVSKITSTCT